MLALIDGYTNTMQTCASGPARAVNPAERQASVPHSLGPREQPHVTHTPYQAGIQSQKKSTIVAQQIVQAILDNQLTAGDRLAPEAAMCVQFEVGRGTVREALRVLEHQGVITIKTGPGGGPTVAGFDARSLAETVALHLQLHGGTFRDVMNARLVIEPAIAGAAAEHRDEQTAHQLKHIVTEAHHDSINSDRTVAAGAQFHDVVAAGTGNPFFEGLLLALHRITEPFAARLPYEGDRRERLLEDHRAIADAIADGDRDRATEAMRADLVEFIGFAEEVAPHLFNEPVKWGEI